MITGLQFMPEIEHAELADYAGNRCGLSKQSLNLGLYSNPIMFAHDLCVGRL
jgi:hypothetical protein